MCDTLKKKNSKNNLEDDVEFPKWSSKKKRKIGNNEVVLKAVKDLKDYCSDALFVVLVPKTGNNLNSFFNYLKSCFNNNKCCKDLKKDLVDNLGYLLWEDVEKTVNAKN